MNLETARDGSSATTDDDLDHWFCCDENRAMCGVDLTNVPFGPMDDDAALCVVCCDMDSRVCERCGA